MGFAQGFSVGANARAQRDERRQLAEQRNQELQIRGYDFSNGQMTIRENSVADTEQLAAQEAVTKSKAIMSRLYRAETAQAFEDFSLTGDTSYLNNDLNSSSEKKAAWAKKGVQLVSNIDFENDYDILNRSGFTSSMYDTEEKRNTIKKNAYKVYNGKDWTIGLANQAMAETGAYKTLGNRRATPALDNHKQLVSLLSGPKVHPYTAEGHKYEKQINAAAEKYNIPPDLIASMIHQESRANPKAVSPKGASGLMQLMPETAAELGVTDPHNPDQNIDAGTKYLRQQLDKYGDVKLALAAYNAGPGNVDKYKGVPPFGETQKYIQNITERLDDGGQYYNRTSKDIFDIYNDIERENAVAKTGKTRSQFDASAPLDELKTRAETAKLISDVEEAPLKRAIDERTLDIREKEARVKLLTEGATTTSKDLASAEKVTNSLIEKYGDEDKFFKQTKFDAKDKVKALEIMELRMGGLSEQDKTNITEINQLISLGEDVSKLDENDTGIVDNFLGDIRSYYSDNVKGKAAKSSYSTFKNIFRKQLFGAALSSADISQFKAAYGSLGMQAGPVLEMFKTSLLQVKSRMDSVQSTMDPYSAQVLLGGEASKLNNTISDIANKVEELNKGSYTSDEVAAKLFAPVEKTDTKPPIDELITRITK